MSESSHNHRHMISNVIAFLCGGSILSLTLVSSRALGPHYGVTLFLWTALGSVTLISLAAGFMVGGLLANRSPDSRVWRKPLVAAGIWLLAAAWLVPHMLHLDAFLGLRLSVFVTALLLFGPPLAIMTAVIPILLRQSVASGLDAGRAAGRLLAVFALGSACGMSLCGYYLIPQVGVDLVLKGLAFTLIAVGMLTGRMDALSASMLPLSLFGIWLMPDPPARAVSEGRVRRLESPYSLLEVYELGPVRKLFVDGRLAGTVDVRDGQSLTPLDPVLSLPAAFRSGAGRVLQIGLGDGSLARAYARQGWSVEAVEVDPEVIRMAYGYFGLTAADASVFQADGRAYLRLGAGPFDVIVLAAFPEGHLPYHLASREAVALARSKLAPDGMLLLHAPVVGAEASSFYALASTLREQFTQVWVLPLSETLNTPTRKVLLACDTLPQIRRPEAAGPYAQLVWSKRQSLAGTSQVVTDSRNPMDLYWERIQPAGRGAGL